MNLTRNLCNKILLALLVAFVVCASAETMTGPAAEYAVPASVEKTDSRASFGFRMAVGYNTFWNVDHEHSVMGLMTVNGLDEMQGIWAGLGGTLKFPLGSGVWVRPGLNFTYQSKTGSVTVDFDGSDDGTADVLETLQQLGHLTIKQILLDIPLMLRFQAQSGFFVEAGPQFTINLSTEMDYSVLKIAVDNMARDFVVSGAVFVGTSFVLGAGRLEIGTGFAFSMTSLIADDLEIPGLPLTFDGATLVDPKDLVIQFETTYWFM